MVVKSDSIADLAEKIGVDVDGLTGRVQRFNRFARSGVDEEFHRGESAYDKYYLTWLTFRVVGVAAAVDLRFCRADSAGI